MFYCAVSLPSVAAVFLKLLKYSPQNLSKSYVLLAIEEKSMLDVFLQNKSRTVFFSEIFVRQFFELPLPTCSVFFTFWLLLERFSG